MKIWKFKAHDLPSTLHLEPQKLGHKDSFTLTLGTTQCEASEQGSASQKIIGIAPSRFHPSLGSHRSGCSDCATFDLHYSVVRPKRGTMNGVWHTAM